MSAAVSAVVPHVEDAPQVEIVIPVTTQDRDLALSVVRLHSFLTREFPFSAHVTIAAGGGSQGTWTTALALADTFAEVSAVPVGRPGRGAALRAVWSQSQCDVLAYLDTDLSIDLKALVPLVAPLLSGRGDVAIGTRLAPGAAPQRGPRREVTSCGYSLLVQAGLGTGFADAHCGFKAITRKHATELLPRTSEAGWFFDTELLALAAKAGLRVSEVQVTAAAPGRGTGRPPGNGPGQRARLGWLLAGRRPRAARPFHGNAA